MAKKAVDKGPARLPIKKYYARYLNYAFEVLAVDENGNPKVKQNNTGAIQYDSNGDAIHITISYKFENHEVKASKGYKSIFRYDPNDKTAQNVELGKRLEQLDVDAGISVESEDKFDRKENPKAFEEKQARSIVESELNELKETFNDPEALAKKLDELTKPKQ